MLFLSIVFSSIITLCSSITRQDYYLPDRVKTTITQVDWIACLLACQGDLQCLSYNYHTERMICELNSDGVENHCASNRPGIFAKGWTFHQTRPALKGSSSCAPVQNCDCNCGSAQQCVIAPEHGDSPETAAESCKDIFDKRSGVASGAYYIKLGSGEPRLVYCHMDSIAECGLTGGWTLVMKIDGKKGTFEYNANKMWQGNSPYNEDCGRDLSETETKLETFGLTPINEGLCLGMKANGVTKWLKVPAVARGSNLFGILSNHSPPKPGIARSQWKSLVNGSSMQSDCSTVQEGFNVKDEHNATGARARIGLIGFPSCAKAAESRIGFGTSGSAGGMDPTNSCGNEASESADNGKKSIKSFCYILVK